MCRPGEGQTIISGSIWSFGTPSRMSKSPSAFAAQTASTESRKACSANESLSMWALSRSSASAHMATIGMGGGLYESV